MFRAFSYIPKCYFKIIKVVLKKIAKKGGYQGSRNREGCGGYSPPNKAVLGDLQSWTLIM